MQVHNDNKKFSVYKQIIHSDFVTNSCGESWDLSCEQIMSPIPEPLISSSKNNESKIENAWAFT